MNYLPMKKSPSSPSLYLLPLSFAFTSTTAAAAVSCYLRSFTEAMRRKAPTTLFLVFLCLLFFAFWSLLVSRQAISLSELRFHPPNHLSDRPNHLGYPFNHVIRDDINHHSRWTRHMSSIQGAAVGDTISVLLPNWEVLVLVQSASPLLTSAFSGERFYCLFPNKETSRANFSGVLPSCNSTAFKCILPNGSRKHQPFRQPVLTRSPEKDSTVILSPSPVMPRWDFLVYESFSTENDVIVFAKGVNSRQGINRPPEELSCVFGDDVNNNNAVRTPVTSSMQEVFRCQHPNLTAAISSAERIRVSLQINSQNLVVPSAAYYTPQPPPANEKPKSLICATTMVYNVGKFLREWVMYYSNIGVDRFILYDNDSDDNLESVIKELNSEHNYNIERIFWIWPKTQEAGFSHSAVYAKDSCTWMMYVDVDEFIFSPSWLKNSSQPSKAMLPSLLPSSNQSIGQVSIKCKDFGPSEQKHHPVEGVIQGYNCHRRAEQRHKSIVRLDAVDHSLKNVIHHFGLNKSGGYEWKNLALNVAVMNHYKYQAWPEFMTKFRRRVSAFVADWTSEVKPNSKDRTPGLGFQAIKPRRWESMFCEVKDERLKLLTQRWFGHQTPEGLKMAWQR